MYIGIVDVTKSYYFWSGVIEVLCLRTRLIYKFGSALACIYLHSYSAVLNGFFTAVDSFVMVAVWHGGRSCRIAYPVGLVG